MDFETGVSSKVFQMLFDPPSLLDKTFKGDSVDVLGIDAHYNSPNIIYMSDSQGMLAITEARIRNNDETVEKFS